MLTMPEQSKTRRALHKGTRTCAGCGARVDKDRVRSEMVRLVLAPGDDGLRAHVDLAGSGVGRGSWVHARPKCFQDACTRGSLALRRPRSSRSRSVCNASSSSKRSGAFAVSSARPSVLERPPLVALRFVSLFDARRLPSSSSPWMRRRPPNIARSCSRCRRDARFPTGPSRPSERPWGGERSVWSASSMTAWQRPFDTRSIVGDVCSVLTVRADRG